MTDTAGLGQTRTARITAWTLVAGMLAALLAGMLGALFTAAPARAQGPVDLVGEYVYDATGTLDSAERGRVLAALNGLFERTGDGLFIVLVDRFESPSAPSDWANETAFASGLGDRDILLAIAVDDRNYAYSVADDFALTNARIDAVIRDSLVPALREERWADGLVSFADALADAIVPRVPTGIVVGVGAAVLVIVAVIVWRSTRGVRERARAARALRAEIAALASDANGLLVELDDSLKTSAQELGFAVAEFGPDVAPPFEQAIDEARQALTEAFSLRARIEDDEPEPDVERRDMWRRIIELCTKADAALDAQADAFDELRRLEASAPALVTSIGAQREALVARIAAADATIAELRTRHGAASVADIDDSTEQARRLDAFAARELGEARAALDLGRTGQAATDVRAAQQAVGQIEQLLATVETRAAALPEQVRARDAAAADTRADIEEALALSTEENVDAAAITTAVDEARAALSAAEGDTPGDALARIERANAELNAVLGRVRGRQHERERAAAQLERMTANATRAIEAADSYITTRRGRISVTPRLRLADAQRALAAGLAETDPVRALAQLQRAHADAGRADRIARDEVNEVNRRSGGWNGGSSDYSSGAFLGGILDELFGGYEGGSSSGWGGSSSSSSRSGWSSSSRSSSSRSSSSRSSSSSSSSSRRSGGSRSSSSRRSGGGRF